MATPTTTGSQRGRVRDVTIGMNPEGMVGGGKTPWEGLDVELQRRCLSLTRSEGAVGISHALKMSTWTTDSVVAWLLNKDMSLVKAARRDKFAVCKGLLEAGARADDSDSLALRIAAARGHLEVCKLLLSQLNNPARPDAQDSQAVASGLA